MTTSKSKVGEKKAEEWIKIAQKYIPDLNDDQKRLINSMAFCKKFDEELLKKAGYDAEMINCNCGLCMMITITNLFREKTILTPNL